MTFALLSQMAIAKKLLHLRYGPVLPSTAEATPNPHNKSFIFYNRSGSYPINPALASISSFTEYGRPENLLAHCKQPLTVISGIE
jgi:hypothetical protein